MRQEPGRADYLRELSVSYDRMGDLVSALGAGDEARDFYSKALEIRERLVWRAPARADYAWDLAVALTRTGDVDRARDIVERLSREGKLRPGWKEWWANWEASQVDKNR